VSEIKIAFGIPPERPTPNIAPSWNLRRPIPRLSFIMMPETAAAASR